MPALGDLDRDLVRRLHDEELARFRDAHPRSLALLERARAHMPNGTPMAWMASDNEQPIYVDRGEGASFTDVDGSTYLDFNASDLSAFCGHANPAIVRAVQERAARSTQFLLPTDDVVATPVKTQKLDRKGKSIIEWQNPRVSADPNCPDDAAGLDIGPATIKAYADEVVKAKTILWNGPMGLFENKQFAQGTNAVAQAVVDATQKNGAKSIIGGGDSVKALNVAGLGDKVSFMSTGGGASLEFLEGAVLPGVAALSEK
jgi:hypothetical protein